MPEILEVLPPARNPPAGCRLGTKRATSIDPVEVGSTHQLFADQLTLVGQENEPVMADLCA